MKDVKIVLLKGESGNNIASIEKTGTSGLTDTYTITLTDGTTTEFEVTNGADGADGTDGQDGNGIASIEKTSTVGLVDTYTITYTNGNTDTFTVTNGSGGGSASDISFDPTNTSLPSTANTVQKAIEALAPPAVTVTLTLKGAKEDNITIKDSNNETVGTCIFASGETQGNCQIAVPIGGGTYKFISSVAKDTTSGANDYEKTVTLSDTTSQLVNIYPDNCIYWYGNEIEPINYGMVYNGGSVTKNTNGIVVSGTFVNGQHFGSVWVYASVDFGANTNANILYTDGTESGAITTSTVNYGTADGYTSSSDGTWISQGSITSITGTHKLTRTLGTTGTHQIVCAVDPLSGSTGTNTITIRQIYLD